MSDWPWLQPAHLGRLMGVGRTRLYQVLERLRELGLVMAVDAEGHRCLALSDRGLAVLARRDRTAVGLARQRWSAAPVKPDAPLTWRNVHGSRSRQLLRNQEHTQAVHWFLAVLANQSRSQGWRVVQFDPAKAGLPLLPPRRPPPLGAPRRLRRPEARGEGAPLFPGVGAAGGAAGHDGRPHRPLPALLRLQPALDDHGVAPAVLVVFDDELAAGHFLRVASDETRRAEVRVPLWVSHRNALDRLGPLGKAWQSPGRWETACPFY